jgi:hypothetical protein
MPTDTLTALLRGILRYLMIRSPMRTSIGATGGVFSGVLLDLFRPVTNSWVYLAHVSDFRLAVGGIFLANILGPFQQQRLPDAIEEQFSVVARGVKEGKLSQAQAKIYYAQIVSTALESAKLSAATQREVDMIGSDASTNPPRRSPKRAASS